MVLLAGLSTGCGATSRHLVTRPAIENSSARTVVIKEELAGNVVPAEASEQFQKALSNRLHARGAFGEGSELMLKWRFAQYDEGSRFLRWLVGGSVAGKGSLVIMANYYDPAGKELSTTQAECEISMGTFGGAFSDVVDKCADSVAEYTIKTFRRDPAASDFRSAPAPVTSTPPPPVIPAAAVSDGCAKDTDCKGDRVCVKHVCVAP